MPHIILLLVIVGAVSAIVYKVMKSRNRPDARLKRDFRRLKRMILGDLKRVERKQAEGLLDACQAHIESLLKAKEQHQLLQSMSRSAQELTGVRVPDTATHAAEDFDRHVAESLARFFGELGRITALIGLRDDDPLLALREFTEDLEEQRAILSELSHELRSTSGIRSSVSTLSESSTHTEVQEAAPSSRGL